jgi:phage portal protein BeeE
VATDASSDIELTSYKGNYLKNGAMPSIAVTYEPTLSQEALEAFVPVFASKFTGALNAGKVLHFLGGRDVKTVGATLDQLAFKAVQGAGETRIAAAAGVPATVAMFSEGMQGSSLNAGNYGASRRLFGDAKVRPLLGAFVEAFSTLLPVPADSRLWYDDSGVSFFQEDVTDEANIRAVRASTIRSLIETGYDPDSAVLAVTTGRYESLLGEHSGMTSVQLIPPVDPDAPTEQEGLEE